jgi:hypothetical protein
MLKTIPPGSTPGNPPVGLPGVLGTSKSRPSRQELVLRPSGIEPSAGARRDLPCLGEAMPFTDRFSAIHRSKTDCFGQTPRSPSQRVGGRSRGDRPRLPTLRPVFRPNRAISQGTHAAGFAFGLPSARRHARLKCRPAPLLVYIDLLGAAP